MPGHPTLSPNEKPPACSERRACLWFQWRSTTPNLPPRPQNSTHLPPSPAADSRVSVGCTERPGAGGFEVVKGANSGAHEGW
jgi:hypothetical protein